MSLRGTERVFWDLRRPGKSSHEQHLTLLESLLLAATALGESSGSFKIADAYLIGKQWTAKSLQNEKQKQLMLKEEIRWRCSFNFLFFQSLLRWSSLNR